jgi:hypothetical protein
MKYVLAILALVLAASAQAQTVPDLKGTWIFKGKSVVFGTNPHHPTGPAIDPTPRIRDADFTFVITGQEGRLAWGYNFSSVSAAHEPMAWAIATDGKTVVGADTDGSYRLTVVSADRLELCYTHSGLSLSKSIVATCEMMDRKK